MPIRKPNEGLNSTIQQSCEQYYDHINTCMLNYIEARLRKHHHRDPKTSALERIANRFYYTALDQDLSDPVRQTKLDLIEYTFAYITSLSQHKHNIHRFNFFKPKNPAPGYKQYRGDIMELTHCQLTNVYVPMTLAFTSDIVSDIEQQLDNLLAKCDRLTMPSYPTTDTYNYHVSTTNDSIQIHAIDADGCFLLCDDDPDHANHGLIQFINQTTTNNGETVVVSFSSRTCISEDKERSHTLNTNFFLDDKKTNFEGDLTYAFRDKPAIQVDTQFLLSDINSKRRQKFTHVMDTTTHIDEKKLLRTYQIAHHFAYLDNKGTSMTIHLYDNRQDILDSVITFYNANPQLLPSNITLKAHCYDIEEQNFQKPLFHTSIAQGQGAIDARYNNNLAGICDNVARQTNQLSRDTIKQLHTGRLNWYYEQVQKQLNKLQRNDTKPGKQLPGKAEKLYQKQSNNDRNGQTLADSSEQCLHLHYLGMTSQLLDEVTQSPNFEEVFQQDLQHITNLEQSNYFVSNNPCYNAI